MTVQELIEELLRYNLEDEVVIRASYTFLTIGPSPATHVTGTHKGFDWDKGKIFIQTEPHLVQLNNYQYSEFCKEIRQHDWIRSDIHYGRKPRGVIPPMFNPTEPEDKSKE